MLTPRAGKLVATKLAYGVTCLFAAVTLVVAGYAHKAVGYITQTEKGITISGSPTTGAMNILVMGLESRTNYEGQTLSAQQLTETHSGNVNSVSSGQVGAQDTDTLILIHIFAGGQKAIGFSIPRDDLVTYPHATYLGITQGKIDQAYDFAYNQSLQQTYGSSMSQSERYLKANQAGQGFEVATVSAITGVKIDHFVEANLIGFYSLAQAFGGIEVCVMPWKGNYGANLADHGFRLERDRGRLQLPQGGQAVPAPRGGPGPCLRPRPRHAPRHRHRPDETAAGGSGLRDLEAEERRRVQRLQHDQQPGLDREPVPHHGLDLRPGRLRRRHARAHRQAHDVPDPADLRSGDRHAAQRLPAGRQHHQRALHQVVRAERVLPEARRQEDSREDHQQEEGPRRPGARHGHGGRVQRQRRERASGRHLAGAGRPGLQGRRRRGRVESVADPRVRHPGVLRRGSVGERGDHRDQVRREGASAVVAARRSRGGAARLECHAGAREPDSIHARRARVPRPRVRRRRRRRPRLARTTARQAALSRSRRTRLTASPACTERAHSAVRSRCPAGSRSRTGTCDASRCTRGSRRTRCGH